MSPEQARGQEADKRSDIWAFGVVLMEMLTGQTVYKGDTISDTLASVLAREPEWDDLPADTPRYLRRLLDRCLEKDLRNRLRDIGEARIALESPEPDPDPVAEAPDGEAAVTAPAAEPSRLPWVVAAAAILAAIILGFLMFNEPGPPGNMPTTRLTTQLPEDHEPWLAWGSNLAFSPDGRSIAYVIRPEEDSQLFVRDLDNLDAREITDAVDARQLFFSPDGKWIGFFTDTELKKVATTGGASFTLAKASTSRGGSWGADDTIYFAPSVDGEIFRIPASGGEPEAVTARGDNIRSHRWPQLLPDGRHLLFTSQPIGSTFDDATIELIDLETGEVSVLHRGGSTGRLLPTGHLVFVREGTLFAAPLDLVSKSLTAQPGPVATGLYFDPSSGAMHLTASIDGTVFYVTGQSAVYEVTPYLVGLDGSEDVVTPEARNYRSPRFSPDGSRIAFDFDSEGGERDVWIYDLTRKVFSRMTFHEENDRFPVWFPNGDRVAFMSPREDKRSVWVRAADGSGADEMLLSGADKGGYVPSSFSPDGRYLALDIWSDTEDAWDLGVLDAESGEMSVYLDTEFQERRPSFSPDGRRIVYQSDESGRFEIYVRPFPDTGGRWQVSVSGGWYPRWSPEGDGILFRSETGIERAQVESEGEALQISRPEVLIEGDQDQIAWHPFFPMFDISPDGQSIVLFREVEGEEGAPAQIQAVFNWYDELNELVPIP
jgi:serine/threonine-protein kinase